MNMNKVSKIIILIVSLFTCIIIVNADDNDQKIPCSTYTNQNACYTNGKCYWNGTKTSGTCMEGFVAKDACNEKEIKKILQIFGFILVVAKLVIPLLIIGYGTIDLMKAITDKDEKSLSKQAKRLLIRIIAGLFVFFLPSIIETIFDMVSDINNSEQYKTCAACVLDPLNKSKCTVE